MERSEESAEEFEVQEETSDGVRSETDFTEKKKRGDERNRDVCEVYDPCKTYRWGARQREKFEDAETPQKEYFEGYKPTRCPQVKKERQGPERNPWTELCQRTQAKDSGMRLTKEHTLCSYGKKGTNIELPSQATTPDYKQKQTCPENTPQKSSIEFTNDRLVQPKTQQDLPQPIPRLSHPSYNNNHKPITLKQQQTLDPSTPGRCDPPSRSLTLDAQGNNKD